MAVLSFFQSLGIFERVLLSTLMQDNPMLFWTLKNEILELLLRSNEIRSLLLISKFIKIGLFERSRFLMLLLSKSKIIRSLLL